MRLTKVLGYYGLILLLAVVLLVSEDAVLMRSDKLCRGLVIADVAVGGLSVAEAEQKVAAVVKQLQTRPAAILLYEKQRWEVGWDAVAGNMDAAALVRQAYGIGRAGSLPQ